MCSGRPGPAPTLRARSLRSLVLLGPSSSNAASWPIRARFQLLYTKLSQNREVSPKYVHKACLSPHFQNGLQKSPLDISEKRFWLAFSHKELMAHFGRGTDFMVKMTKCRPYVHPYVTRKGRSIPPATNTVGVIPH